MSYCLASIVRFGRLINKTSRTVRLYDYHKILFHIKIIIINHLLKVSTLRITKRFTVNWKACRENSLYQVPIIAFKPPKFADIWILKHIFVFFSYVFTRFVLLIGQFRGSSDLQLLLVPPSVRHYYQGW